MIHSHLLNDSDREPAARLRALAATKKGNFGRPESRAFFDEMMSRLPAARGIEYEPARVGGVPGWWCRPAGARADVALLHVHGGGFVVGSATTHRYFAGQIAASAGVSSFLPDYRLAPEHPFPAASEDVAATYDALASAHASVFLVGDSAGGTLALAQAAARPRTPPRGVVALSPWTDLALAGESLRTRADADPYMTPPGLAASARRYLGDHDPRDPRASPLYGDLTELPPTLIHVGEDELLLDDSLRYAARHPRCDVHVWLGMPHVFVGNVDLFRAATLALEGIGAFVRGLL